MNEKGHAKNLDNFKIGRDFAVSWGASYSPTNPLLPVTNFNLIITNAETTADAVQAERTPWRNATAAADVAFAPLSKLVTRVMNSLRVSGVSEAIIEDAETYSRKIQGRRKLPAAVDDPLTPEVDESAASHSASQMSRIQRIENFNSLISLLSAQSLYDPAETDLKIDTLIALAADLQAKVDAVNLTFTALSNALGNRDTAYYADGTGLVAVGKLFKKYVQSAFGTNSVQYNQIKGLSFTKYTRK